MDRNMNVEDFEYKVDVGLNRINNAIPFKECSLVKSYTIKNSLGHIEDILDDLIEMKNDKVLNHVDPTYQAYLIGAIDAYQELLKHPPKTTDELIFKILETKNFEATYLQKEKLLFNIFKDLNVLKKDSNKTEKQIFDLSLLDLIRHTASNEEVRSYKHLSARDLLQRKVLFNLSEDDIIDLRSMYFSNASGNEVKKTKSTQKSYFWCPERRVHEIKMKEIYLCFEYRK